MSKIKDSKNVYHYSSYGLKIASPYKLDLLLSYQNEDRATIVNDPLIPSISLKTTLADKCFEQFDLSQWNINIKLDGFSFDYEKTPQLIYHKDNHFIELSKYYLQHPKTQALLCRQLLPVSVYQGAFGIHASAIVLNDKAIAFGGTSGRGKTTLLTALIAHDEASFLTDDSLAIWPNAMVHPGPTFYQVKNKNTLHGQPKEIIQVKNTYQQACPLTDYVVLAGNDDFQLKQLSEADALVTLMNSRMFVAEHMNVWPMNEKSRSQNKQANEQTKLHQIEFIRAAQLIKKIRVWHFTYPKKMQQLEHISQQFIQHFHSLTS